MADNMQSHDQDKHKHMPLGRRLVDIASDSIEALDLDTFKSTYLGEFIGSHYKEQTYITNKKHRQRGPQGDVKNNTREHLKCKQTTGHPANYDYKQFGCKDIQPETSIDLRSEPISTSNATTVTKCQPEEFHFKNDMQLKETGQLQKRIVKAARRNTIRQSSITSGSAMPGLTPTNSSNQLGYFTQATKSRKSYLKRNLIPVKSSSVQNRLKRSQGIIKIPIGVLPKHCSKQRRRNFFCVYTNLLLFHNKRKSKPITNKKNNTNEDVMKPILSTAIRKKNKKKPYDFERYRQNKIRESKLRVNPSFISTVIPVTSISTIQNFCDQSQSQKATGTPYCKTVTVYSVYDQRTTKRKPAVNLASKSSFNVKFYKSMGDGRQTFGNVSPYMQLPRNYSPTYMTKGRDEDGCICVYIPQDNNPVCMEPTCDPGGNFLKRYFHVLLKENKRCVCAKRRPIPRPCSYGNSGPPCRGRVMMPSGCQCKFNSARRNFRANDAACQCRYKETRERRSDDIYCRDRGTTCIVPALPENDSKSNTLDPCGQQQGKHDKNAVNIGSNFSFQVGLYKRCIDTNPNQYAFPPNQPTFSEPLRNDYYFVDLPANDPNLRYMEGNAQQNIGSGNDCCCSGSDVTLCYEPKPSLFSELFKERPRKVSCRSSSSPYSSDQMISACSSPPSRNYFLKQFERSDLCCNNRPKSHCKPKHKAVRCRCDKKPKVIGCTDSKNVGIVCSTASLLPSSSTVSASCKCYKVKNIGCCCSNEPVMATCAKKKSCCTSSCSGSKKSKKSGHACCSTSNRPMSKKNRKKCSCCSSCNLPDDCCNNRKNKKKCCGCSRDSRKSSILNFFFKEKEPCCCCNERKFSLGRTISMLFQRKRRCNKCNLRKICKCPQKSGEFDYKKIFDNIKLSSKLQKKAEAHPCPCGDFNVKKVLSNLLVPPEPKQQTRAQQCKCNQFDIKKTFGRLLLFNTVQKEMCCSAVSYDQNSRNIGIGEEDYRRLPPCSLYQDKSQGDGFAMSKYVSRLIRPETSTRMHYSAFNPLNQCEAGMQHSSRIGPDDRAGVPVCRNQGSCVPKPKPMTVKDCENANCAALQNMDPNRKAVRIGSSCSFSLEFYKGMPPSKTCPPPCPPTCNPPCPAPCTDTTAPVCNPTTRPCRQSQPFIQKAAKYMLCNNQKPRKPTCKKCNSCAKVPIVKRGFAQLILKDKKPLRGPRTCQKTNTIQPNRKLVTRKPVGKGKGLGATKNCDPYVCLKRINQRKCCK